MTHLLLNSTALHAVEIDQSECEQFRESLLRIDSQLGDHPAADQVSLVTGAALELIEEYGRRVQKVVKMESAEFQRMVVMLADTVSALAAGNDTSIKNLHAISKQI